MNLKRLILISAIAEIFAMALFCFSIASCSKEVTHPHHPQEGDTTPWNAELNELYKEFPGDVWDTTFTESDTTPAPIITGAARTMTYRLIIQNHQLYWNDGIPAKIVEANSPETAFAYLDYNWLDWLHAHGVNTIYVTLNGKEPGKPRISIYKNNDIAQGFDDVKVDEMVAMAQYWCAKDKRKIVHPLLSEKETHFLYTDAQRKAAMAYLVQKFAPVAGHIIWDREEWPNGQTAQAQNLYGYLQAIDPVNIRAMHNNTNQNPWSGLYNSTVLQFLSFQEWQGNFNNRIRTEVLKNAGWAGYASEVTGGFQPNDVAKAELLWNAAPGYNAGVGVYISCCDQRDTRDGWYTAYAPVYDRLAQLAGAAPPPDDDTIVVPPPTGNIIVEYSTTWNKSNAQTLNNNATLTQGSYWLFVRTGAAPMTFTLKKGTGTPITKTDPTAPFDYNGNNNTYLQRGYTYTLTVTDGSGQSVVINFTVN